MPGPERGSDEHPADHLGSIHERIQLHHQAGDDGPPIPIALLCVETDTSTATAVKPIVGGSTDAHASATRSSACRRQGDPGEIDQRLVPDDREPGGHAAHRQGDDGDGGKAQRRSAPFRRTLGAAARPREHGLPGAIAVLGGKHVAADEAREHRKGPQRGKSE